MAHEPSPAARELVDELVQLSFVIQAVITQIAAAHDLSVPQLRLLGVLRDRQPGMQDLAVRFGVDKSSMTGLVERAERRGLVRRQPAPHDRRSVQVSITQDGRALTTEVETVVYEKVSGLLEQLSAADRARLEAIVRQLTASWPRPGRAAAGQAAWPDRAPRSAPRR